jgi:hypothetical protein
VIRDRLRRADRATLVFAVLAGATALLLLLLGRGTTFIADEWSFIDTRQAWDVNAFMVPHNEHWSAGAVLVYKLLLATVGLRTYLPYQVVVVLLHVTAASALYCLVRREAGATAGLCAGAIFLLLGSGAENLMWPFHIAWNGTMAAGGWALVLVLKREPITHPIVAAVLLVVAVATSGVGLFFVVAVAVALALRSDRRRQLWIVLPAIVIYGAWYLAFGRYAVQSGLFDPANLKDVPDYMVLGIGNAVGRVIGWGAGPGLIVATILVVATVWRSLGQRPLLVGAVIGIVGLLTQFGLTGLARARFGIEQAASQRYVYVAAFFVLIALGSWLATRRMNLSRTRVAIILGGLVAVSMAANLFALFGARSYFFQAADQARAIVTVITRFGGSPALPANQGIHPIPGRERLEQLFAAYGSPLNDALTPVADPSPAALDAALFGLVGAQLIVTEGQLPTAAMPAPIDASSDLNASEGDGCAVLESTGPAPRATTHLLPGTNLVVASA